MSKPLDLLIIGAGPAGIAAAVEAEELGLRDVLVVEKGPSHSSMIRNFYKEGKRVDATYAGIEALCMGFLCLRDGNRESYLQFMDQVVQHHRLSMRFNTEVWSIEREASGFATTLSGAERVSSRFVIVAIGKMGRPKQPDYYKGLGLELKRSGTLVFDINATDFTGKRVLVVGGGDSASEYAQMLSETSQVTLSYRQTQFASMNALNARLLREKIETGRVRALLGSNIQTIELMDGHPRVGFREPGFNAETFDYVLFGLGGMSPNEFMTKSGIANTERGEAAVSEVNETSVPGLYVVGDLAGKGHGGGSIIAGFNAASLAVRDILGRHLRAHLPAERVSLEHFFSPTRLT